MRQLSIIAITLLLTACASGGRPRTPAARNQLTGSQIRATDAANVYYAVQALRPQWLGSRGPTSASDPTPTTANVAVNGQMTGNIDFLRTLNILDVESVRFLSAGEASARYGMGHPRGVIEVDIRTR